MAKTEDQKLQERLEEISQLVRQRAEIDARLKELTGIRTPRENGVIKPDGFILTDAMKEVLGIAGLAMKVKDIQTAIGNRYSFFPETKNIRATAKYLVKQGWLSFNNLEKTYTIGKDKKTSIGALFDASEQNKNTLQ